MATLMTITTGNFTTAATWALCNAVAELDSEASTTNISTSNLDSAVFQPGVVTADGVAIKVSAIITPTGTITVTFRNSTGSVDVKSVTINCSDLHPTAAGWVFFKWDASQLLLGVTDYIVRVVRSVADSASNRVTLFRNATTNNHSRQLRTTATQAPAAADKLIGAGEFTGAGTSNSFTITMDNTATTSFGPTVSGGPPQGVTVNDKCTFTWGTAASTNYYFRWKGILQVYPGGTWNYYTSGTPCPSTSTAVMEMDSVANVDTGIEVTGTFNAYGATKSTLQTKMTVDKVGGNTVIAVLDTTGWAVSDEVCFPSTSRTPSESEKKTTLTVDSATQITLTAGLTNAHTGTNDANGDIRCEVGNLTRNVKIRGVSASLQGYVRFNTTGAVTGRYIEFSQLGSGTTNKRGIEVQTTSGSCDIQFCSVHDSTVGSSVGVVIAATTAVTFSSNVVFGINGSSCQAIALGGTANHVVTNNLVVMCGDNNVVSITGSGSWTFSNNTVAGCAVSTGASVGISIAVGNTVDLGTFDDNVVHSSASASTQAGIGISSMRSGTLLRTTTWRCGVGVLITTPAGFTIDTLTSFGHGAAHIRFSVALVTVGNMKNLTLNSGVTLTCPIGIRCGVSSSNIGVIADSSFGATTSHATGDVEIVTAGSVVQLRFHNCLFASSSEIANQTNLAAGSSISSQKHDQTAGLHKEWMGTGTITIDTTIFDVTPSERLTPNNATKKLEIWTLIRAAVANGTTATVSVRVRESVAGDGTDYNGARARLRVRANPAAGIASDTTLATATIASEGAWETLSGTTAAVTDDCYLEFYVDCDGTTGWVNVDTVTLPTPRDTKGLSYWSNGEALAVGDNSAGGGMLVHSGMTGGMLG